MARRGYLPTDHELRAELLRQAQELYNSEFGPGINEFMYNCPVGWATTRTISSSRGYSQDTAGWRTLVEFFTGLDVLTQSQIRKEYWAKKHYQEDLKIVQKQRNTDKASRSQYIPLIDNFDISLHASSERIVGNKVYRLLR